MKKVAVAFIVALLTFSNSFAGENPKLLKEIKRKITLDLSKIKLEQSKENFVLVQFRVKNGEIDVINVEGTEEKLTELMLCELEEMFINTKTDPHTIHQFKFTFTKE